MMPQPGRLFGLGVGPGDPELITLKALRLLQAAPVVAYHAAKGKKGNALTIVERYLNDNQLLVPLIYPVTTEILPAHMNYEAIVSDFYGEITGALACASRRGTRMWRLSPKGIPSSMARSCISMTGWLKTIETEVVPGVCSILGGAAVLGAPLVYRNQTLTVLSGVLPAEDLKVRLGATEAAAIMKLGKNLAKVRGVIEELGLMDRALYVERATMDAQRIFRLPKSIRNPRPIFR